MQKIKEKYYIHKKTVEQSTTTAAAVTSSALTVEDVEKIKEITDLDAGLIAYINAKTATLADSDKMDIYEKSDFSLGVEAMEKLHGAIVEARNSFIKTKMAELGVAPERIEVRNAAKEESEAVTAAQYSIKIKDME